MSLELSAVLNGERRVWPLEGDVITVGRSSRNGMHLPDATVSKEHAEIVRQGQGWLVRDLSSRNGTRVNGNEVKDSLPLRAGDTVEFGHVLVRLGSPLAEAHTQFSESVGLGSSIRIRAQQILERSESRTKDPELGRLVRVLTEAGRVLVLPRPLRETCEELLRFVEQAVPASRLIMLLREESGEMVQVAARTRGVSAREPLVLSRTIMETVLNEVTSVITRDASADPRFQAQMSIVSQGIHSAMAVPLFDNQNVLGLLYADSNVLTTNYNEELLEIFTLLGNMAAVKITNARLLETEQARQRMVQELSTATRIQRALLPPVPELPGWQCLARLVTCFEVGGDLYDFYRRDDGVLVFTVGDVSGKGMGAALLMSSVISSARVLYDTLKDPADLITRLNAVVYRSTDAGHFVTMFLGCLDPATGRLSYVNAGHNAPVLLGAGEPRLLEATGVPVGILPDFPFAAGEVTIEPGAMLSVFTDGVPEASKGDEFFDDARLLATLSAHAHDEALEQVAGAVVSGVEEFLSGAPRTDDITLLFVRRDAAR